MCWTTRKAKLAKQKIADRPIRVFKVCQTINEGTSVVPYFYCFNIEYKTGDTYTINLNEPSFEFDTLVYTIQKGFHSYNSAKNTILTANHVIVSVRCERGYRIGYYEKCKHLVKVDCTIPKGSTYYENEIGEIVSDTIRIDSFTPIS